MKMFNVSLATAAALVTMTGSALADITIGPISLPIDLGPISGAPAPALAAGIPALIIVGGALFSSKIAKRFRGK